MLIVIRMMTHKIPEHLWQAFALCNEEQDFDVCVAVPAVPGFRTMASTPEEFLKECKTCQQMFSDPRLQLCTHTFRLPRLEGYLDAADYVITCPLCRRLSKISTSGFGGQRVNCVIADLTDSVDLPSPVSHINYSAEQQQQQLRCNSRSNEEAQTCIRCLNEWHRPHAWSRVSVLDADVRVLLENDISSLTEASATCRRLMQDVLGDRNAYLSQTASFERRATDSDERLKDLIDRCALNIVKKLRTERKNRNRLAQHVISGEINNHVARVESAKLAAEGLLRGDACAAVAEQATSLHDTVGELQATIDVLRRKVASFIEASMELGLLTAVTVKDRGNTMPYVEKQVVKGNRLSSIEL